MSSPFFLRTTVTGFEPHLQAHMIPADYGGVRPAIVPDSGAENRLFQSSLFWTLLSWKLRATLQELKRAFG